MQDIGEMIDHHETFSSEEKEFLRVWFLSFYEDRRPIRRIGKDGLKMEDFDFKDSRNA